MSKKIVVSVDALNIDRSTVNYAAQLAKNMQLELEIFSVQFTAQPIAPTPIIGESTHQVLQTSEILDTARKNIQELVGEVSAIHPRVSTAMTVGFKGDEIVNHANDDAGTSNEVQLVVMAKKSDDDWFNEFFGTSETAVAEKADVPVLLLPPDSPFEGLHHIVFPLQKGELDFSQLHFLVELARPFKGIINVVYLSDDAYTEEELGVIRGNIAGQISYPLNVIHFDKVNDVADVKKMSRRTLADLLAISRKEENFFQRLTHSDTTRHHILDAHQPILVF